MLRCLSSAILNDDMSLLMETYNADWVTKLCLSTNYSVKGVDLPDITLLHQAILYRKPVFVEYFLAHNFPPDKSAALSQLTPLKLAIFLGYEEIVELLIFYKADINLIDNYGVTPLEYAVSQKREDIVEILLRSSIPIKDFVRPLHAAITTNQINIVKMLIIAGADPKEKAITGKSAFDIVKKEQVDIKNVLNQTCEELKKELSPFASNDESDFNPETKTLNELLGLAPVNEAKPKSPYYPPSIR